MNQHKNYIVAIFARGSSNNNFTTYYILNKVTLTVSYKCAYCSCISLHEVQII